MGSNVEAMVGSMLGVILKYMLFKNEDEALWPTMDVEYL
jgi:hypothetical protein